MTLIYPIITVKVEEVFNLEVDGLRLGTAWHTGNVLFRASEWGSVLKMKMNAWASGVDGKGRNYLLWVARNSRVEGLVIQPMDSSYCFEVSPADS